ncbi:hypothetical protein [Paramuribaculum intestinale]|uniref:hypothetical protein n=1 Tax=Paramuribaculum intestinale TaxID=2094151 RepID=UPI00272B6BE5|nr:hypothetical protein [Paramuribaculum intestinale]
MNNEKQSIKNALTNVRGAFRTLASYQQSMLSVVNYIKNRSGIQNARIYGAKRFSNPIRTCRQQEDYDANLNIFNDMWSWDFLYGYMFEYYLGKHTLATNDGEKEVSISIIQVSDDGYITSQFDNKKRDDLECFNSPGESNSWLIMCVGYGDGWYYIPQIMSRETYSLTPWAEVAFQAASYVINAQASTYINRQGVDGSECLFMAKTIPMESCFDAVNIDSVLAEFSNQLKQECGLELFKS